MPIAKAEIIATLSDPKLNMMKFYVEKIEVSSEQYRIVSEYIKDDDIKVIPGRGTVAFYDGRYNTIETQSGNPPLDLADRAQIIHECTHAIADVNELDILRLNDEVAAYLAQVTYMSISNPVPLPPANQPFAGHGSPLGNLVFSLTQVMQKYNLHNAQGFGARISELDVWKLAGDIRAFPLYAHVKTTEKSVGAGVPVKNNQMRKLQAALRGGQQGNKQTAYTPSPRFMIF